MKKPPVKETTIAGFNEEDGHIEPSLRDQCKNNAVGMGPMWPSS